MKKKDLQLHYEHPMCTYKMSLFSFYISLHVASSFLSHTAYFTFRECTFMLMPISIHLSPRQYPRNVHLFCIDFSFYFYTIPNYIYSLFISLCSHCIRGKNINCCWIERIWIVRRSRKSFSSSSVSRWRHFYGICTRENGIC